MPSKSARDLVALQDNFKALDEAVAAKFVTLDKQLAALGGIVKAQHELILALQPKIETLEIEMDQALLRPRRYRIA